MSNLATIVNNILADSGIDDINVVVTTGSYSNPAWITALSWTKITDRPTTLAGYGITDAVPSSRTITINGTAQDLSANRTFNVGTVTSVAALTLGTSGTDLSSSVANGTTTPVITLNVPTASAANRGALSAADWTTFNNKQNALTNPVTGIGTTNYLPKFTGTSTIGNSGLSDDGTLITTAQRFSINVPSIALLSIANGGASANYFRAANTYFQTVAGGELLYIHSAGVSVGNTNTTYKLDVSGTGNFTGALSGTSATFSSSVEVGAGTYSSGLAKLYTSSVYGTILTGKSGSSSDMLLTDRSGNIAFQILANGSTPNVVIGNNLGLSVTPSAWQTANRQVFQFGKSIYSGFIGYNTSSASTTVGSNCYSTGSSEAVWTYLNDSAASLYQAGGAVGHVWYQAPSGTAGNAISFTQAMTLFATGNLLVGTPSPISDNGARLQVSGSARYQFRNASNEIMDLAITTSSAASTSNISLLWYGNETASFRFIRGSDSTGGQMALWTQPEGGSITERMRIFSDGNVGINTGATNNGARLQVSGTSALSGNVTIFTAGYPYIDLGINSSNYWRIINDNPNDSFVIGKNGSTILRIAGGGQATFSLGIEAKKALFGISGVATPSLIVNDNDQSNVRLRLQNSTSGNTWDLVGGLNASNNSDFSIYDVTNNVTALRIVPVTGAATFSSSVTASQFLATSNNNNAAIITSTGTVGYGLVAVGSAGGARDILLAGQSGFSNGFTVQYTGSAMKYSFQDGNVLIGTTTPNGNTLRVNGTIFSDSSVTATSFFESSDATLKTLVADNYQAKGIDSVVAKLYIKNGKQELGYYAQDLQGILPSAVSKGADGLLNLSYREVHTAKIAALEKEVAELKQQLKNN